MLGLLVTLQVHQTKKELLHSMWKTHTSLSFLSFCRGHGLAISHLNLEVPRFLYIGQAFRYSPENAFYIFNQQIYFLI